MNSRLSAQLVRYALVGLVNTAIGYGCILLLRYGMGWQDFTANATGYAVGACVSYVLNRNFTFSSRRAHARAVPWFLLTIGVSYALNAAVLLIGLHWLKLPSFASQGLAIVVYNIAFFLLSRVLVFDPPRAV